MSRIARSAHILLALGLGGTMLAGVWLLALPARALAAPGLGPSCFAEYTGDNTTDFEGGNAGAVRLALAAVPTGGVVKVAGNCVGTAANGGTTQVLLITRSVTLLGGYIPTDWVNSHPLTQVTTLNAVGGGRVISLTAPATLSGLVLKNGLVTDGPGAGLYTSQPVTLTNLVIRDNVISGTDDAGQGGGAYLGGVAMVAGTAFIANTSYREGGGAFVGAGGSKLTNSAFLSNTATAGEAGGLRVLAGSAVAADHLLFLNNRALSGVGGAGSWDGPGYLHNSQVLSNSAFGRGGGFYFVQAMVVSNTTFISNTSGDTGGGANFFAPAIVHQVVFSGNSAFDKGGGAYFGAAAGVSTSSFINNLAKSYSFQGRAPSAGAGSVPPKGGGAYFTGLGIVAGSTFDQNRAFYGAGAYFAAGVVVTGSSFEGNSGNWGGGAMFDGDVSVSQSSFRNNSAYFGGGVQINNEGDQVSANITNTVFAGNTATSTQGLALYFGTDGFVRLAHVTIASPTVAGGSAIYVNNFATVEITDTIIASHTIGIERLNGAVSEDYNLFDSVAVPFTGTVSAGSHSITGTAAFVNPAAGDYHLMPVSDAVDSGSNVGVSVDFDGTARPVGSGFDIGAYEAFAAYRLWLPLLMR